MSGVGRLETPTDVCFRRRGCASDAVKTAPPIARTEESVMDHLVPTKPGREPWNKGKLVGQKAPLKLKDIWAIRIRLQMYDRLRDLALFDLAIDSKLRACDLVKIRVCDVSHGERV